MDNLLFAGVLTFLLIMLASIYWPTAREWNAYLLLKKSGVTTTAKILYATKRVQRGTTCFVTYQFDDKLTADDATVYAVTQQIGYEKYRVLHEGGNMTVRYLIYNPKIVRLSDLHEDLSIRNRYTLVACIGIVIFLPLILFFLVTFLLDRIWIVYSAH